MDDGEEALLQVETDSVLRGFGARRAARGLA